MVPLALCFSSEPLFKVPLNGWGVLDVVVKHRDDAFISAFYRRQQK